MLLSNCPLFFKEIWLVDQSYLSKSIYINASFRKARERGLAAGDGRVLKFHAKIKKSKRRGCVYKICPVTVSMDNNSGLSTVQTTNINDTTPSGSQQSTAPSGSSGTSTLASENNVQLQLPGSAAYGGIHPFNVASTSQAENMQSPVETKNPVLKPTKNPIVELLIGETHQTVKHSSVDSTLTALRERLWILRGRQAVKRVLRRCII